MKNIYHLRILLFFFIIFQTGIVAQNISINTDGSPPDSSAMLDIKSSDKGLLIPRLEFINRPAVPATGLLIYQTDNSPGFYYFNGNTWLKIADFTQSDWNQANAAAADYIKNKPENVSVFNNDAGYLTAEVDGLVTNEIQELSKEGQVVSLSLNGGSFTDEVDDHDWGVTGDTIYHENGAVGVGTVHPQAKLDVEGDVRSSELSAYGNKLVQADNDGILQPLIPPEQTSTNPHATSSTGDSLLYPVDLQIQENYAFVSSYLNNKLVSFDISNPENMEVRGSSYDSLLGAGAFTINDTLAFVPSPFNNKLVIFSIADPENPTFVAEISDSLNGPYYAYVDSNYVFVSSRHNNRLVVFDVSDPQNPLLAGYTGDSLSGPSEIVIEGNYAYVTSYQNNRLLIYDISNRGDPQLKGYSSESLEMPQRLAYKDHYVYVSSSANDKLVVFDVSDPANPLKVSEVSDALENPVGVSIYDDIAFVASAGTNAFVMYDISNPSNPAFIGNSSSGLLAPFVIRVSGDYAFVVSYGNNKVVVFNLLQSYMLGGTNGTSWINYENLSPWKTNGSNVCYNSGNVGIGTLMPDASLHVEGNTRLAGDTKLTGNVGFTGERFGIGTEYPNKLLHVNGDSYFESGNVGIGKLWPAAKLHVYGDAVFESGMVGIGTTSPSSQLEVNGDFHLTGEFKDASGDDGSLGQFLTATWSGTNWMDLPNDNDWTIAGNNMYAANTGNLGIGTNFPNNKLEVHGDLRLTGKFKDSSGDSGDPGQYLTANLLGTNWIDLPDDNDWIVSGNDTYVANSGNVGIGTTWPIRKLEVLGDFGAASNGAEFKHTNRTQGIGIGYNSIYACGYNTDQHLNILPRGGAGYVGIGKTNPAYMLDVNGSIAASGSANFDNNANIGGDVHVGGYLTSTKRCKASYFWVENAGNTNAIIVSNNADNYSTIWGNNQHAQGRALNVTTASITDYAGYMACPTNDGNGLYVKGNIGYTGSLWKMVKIGDDQYAKTILPLSTQSEIQTTGSGKLDRGETVITLPESFVKTKMSDSDFRVIITPTALCNGICVVKKSADTFVVKELLDGSSSATFDYVVYAIIKDGDTRSIQIIDESELPDEK
nr:hypothetical protein [Bacteroidota bacterium]